METPETQNDGTTTVVEAPATTSTVKTPNNVIVGLISGIQTHINPAQLVDKASKLGITVDELKANYVTRDDINVIKANGLTKEAVKAQFGIIDAVLDSLTVFKVKPLGKRALAKLAKEQAALATPVVEVETPVVVDETPVVVVDEDVTLPADSVDELVG